MPRRLLGRRIEQDALGGAVEVFILAAAQRPDEGGKAQPAEQQRNGNEVSERRHRAATAMIGGDMAWRSPGTAGDRCDPAGRPAGAKPQGVADDQQRRHRHGDRRNQRRDVAEDGDRHGDGVVADGEREVLPDQPIGISGDVERQRHRLQAVAQEHEVGGIAPDIGGGGGRHGDMRRSQRRRIVQAVADHQRPGAAGRQGRQVRGLGIRQHLACECVDRKRTGHRPRIGEPVARQHLDLQPGPAQLGQRLAASSLTVSSNAKEAIATAVPGKPAYRQVRRQPRSSSAQSARPSL